MNSESSAEDALYDAARRLADPAARAAFLDAACAGNPAQRDRLEKLLSAAPEADDFFNRNAVDLNRLPPLTAEMPTLITPPAEQPGEMIGRYKLLQEIGEGGFGTVWMAEQVEPVSRRVALKIIKLGMDTKEVIARFEAERQALAMMDHPNIAKVLDAGATERGRPFFVMELVKGVTITQYCDEAGLGTRERLALFGDVCSAINHAHQKGIIHRDIKPSNVMITLYADKPVVKVIDFGIAKATQGKLTDKTLFTRFEQFIGTPVYMSPEQAALSAVDIDTRSDIYALGILLYELLTGKPPFDAKSLASAGYEEMRRIIREVEPPKPSSRLSTVAGEERTQLAKARHIAPEKLNRLVEPDLDWIVMKAIEKDRTRRYETANGLALDIQRFLSDEPVSASPPSVGYQFRKFARRNKAALRVAAAIAAVLVAATAVSLRQAVRATRAEREQTTARAGEATQRRQAEAAQENEKQLRKLAELQAYAADMKAAQAALQQNSRQQAVTLLGQYWPKPGEPDLRGVEWRYLWQAAKGDEIHTWKHPGMVAGAHFSPDGKQVATACFDGVLRLWNVASGKLVAQFDRGVRDENIRVSFCYSPDGATLASAARDGIVLLDCATWRVKQTLELAEDERPGLGRMSLICSPDGQWLAALLRVRSVRVWNTESWESFTLPITSGGRISISPDSKTLSVCTNAANGVIELWDLATKKKADVLAGNHSSSFFTVFSPQGDRLVSAGWYGHVALWDIRSRKEVWSQQAHGSHIYGLAFSHDGKRFASGGFDQLIHIWDAATQEKVMTLRGHLNEIWSLEFSPDDRYLLTSSKDGTVKLWDAQTKAPSDYWMLDPREQPVGFTPDGRGLISIADGGATLRLWKGAQVIKSLTSADPFGVLRTTFAPETQSLYALSPGGEVRIHDVNNLKVKRSFKISEPCSALFHVSPDQRWLTGLGTTLQGLHVWDTASGESVAHIKELESASESRDLAVFSPNSQVLAVATANWEVKLWDTTKREFIRTLGPHPWRVNAISFSPDGRQVASSSWAGDVRVFEVATGKETVAPLYGHGSGVRGQSFSSDGATLVSGGDDSSVRFWNVATGREMLVLVNTFNPGARLPFLSPTGELLVWRDFGQNLRVQVQSIPTLAEIETARRAETIAP